MTEFREQHAPAPEPGSPSTPRSARADADRAALDEYLAARAVEETAERLYEVRARYEAGRSDPTVTPDQATAAWREVEASAAAHAAALDTASRSTVVSALARAAVTAEPATEASVGTLAYEARLDDAARCTVAATGEVDMASADVFEEFVRHQLGRPDVTALRLDLGGVTFLDSSGLRVLVQLRRVATAAGTPFALVGVHDRIRRMLEFAHLDELLAPG